MASPHEFHQPKSSYSRDDLIASGRGGYFGPGNAQLPAPPMLMIDRITQISLDGGEFGKGHVVAELDITPDLWFFACHFPGDPVYPGGGAKRITGVGKAKAKELEALAPRQALHAALLAFRHPSSGVPLELRSAWPADLWPLLQAAGDGDLTMPREEVLDAIGFFGSDG